MDHQTGAALVRWMIGMCVVGLFGALVALAAIYVAERWDEWKGQ